MHRKASENLGQVEWRPLPRRNRRMLLTAVDGLPPISYAACTDALGRSCLHQLLKDASSRLQTSTSCRLPALSKVTSLFAAGGRRKHTHIMSRQGCAGEFYRTHPKKRRRAVASSEWASLVLWRPLSSEPESTTAD
eukprot:7391901-Prymnesium_polylepis.1